MEPSSPLVHYAAVFGVEPDLTREGGSIPVTLTFQEATGRNVMLLPVGSSDDGAHSQNEKLNRFVVQVFKNDLQNNNKWTFAFLRFIPIPCELHAFVNICHMSVTDLTTSRVPRCLAHISMRFPCSTKLIYLSKSCK